MRHRPTLSAAAVIAAYGPPNLRRILAAADATRAALADAGNAARDADAIDRAALARPAGQRPTAADYAAAVAAARALVAGWSAARARGSALAALVAAVHPAARPALAPVAALARSALAVGPGKGRPVAAARAVA